MRVRTLRPCLASASSPSVRRDGYGIGTGRCGAIVIPGQLPLVHLLGNGILGLEVGVLPAPRIPLGASGAGSLPRPLFRPVENEGCPGPHGPQEVSCPPPSKAWFERRPPGLLGTGVGTPFSPVPHASDLTRLESRPGPGERPEHGRLACGR